jgi:ABC-type dipeptide/oligopeptide/nickel transport system permease component/ABC-type transport system substrate-binding protein
VNNLLKYSLHFLLTCCGVFGVSYFWGALMKPELEREPIYYSPEYIESTEELRDISFSEEDIYKVHHDVDYSESESGSWYPKGESPILAELVEEGKLPPVAERVGSEPVVIQGRDGLGNYGGTWNLITNTIFTVNRIDDYMTGTSLVRWSPLGDPIVPHIAKRWEVSPDKREWIFYLREGMKWSDGHPFTADDILYWWNDEVKQKLTPFPESMKVKGESGEILKIDPYTVKIIFSHPHGLFLERLPFADYFYSPRHYMEKYHPELGNEELIDATMKANKIPTRKALYISLRLNNNPDHPRIWPWIYRTYKSNPPQAYVRNPYYWAVDTEGNQLPYVDRFMIDVKSSKLVPIAAASGAITMQAVNIYFLHYTLFMSQRDAGGYDVYHWYPSGFRMWGILPNLNKNINPHDPMSKPKRELLKDKRFRQALSLAINRQQIIDAVYYGVGVPTQGSPGVESPFYHEELKNSYIEYNPSRANELLDELGLTGRDSEGYRTFKDGTRMIWYLDITPNYSDGPAPFVVEDWNKVGLKTIERSRSFTLSSVADGALFHDFIIAGLASSFNPLINVDRFAPGGVEAVGYKNWYRNGGLYGNPEAEKKGNIEPPAGHPLRRSMELLDEAFSALTLEEQTAIYSEIQDIAVDNLWNINITTGQPWVAIVKKGFKSVPRNALYGGPYESIASGGLEAYYFEEPDDSPGVIAQIKREMTEITPPSHTLDAVTFETRGNDFLGRVVLHVILGIIAVGLILMGFKHPYIGRRLIIMVPTLLLISIISFTIIQLPPSNYIDLKILQAEYSGDDQAKIEAEQLRELFPADESTFKQYINWLGLPWFLSFKSEERGLLQGHLGFSMESRTSVNEVVGDRILLTFLISLGSILFTWAVALPIGVYSAVRQYSIGDYIITFLGFIGMCVPSFLLALLLMYWSNLYFGISMTGLYSPEYAGQPEWSWGKATDLMQHIWLPVVVLGVTGTASMIRVMRGNLLDELKKPYVVTAMAKGVRPIKLLLKYPVRIALNPFISGIGTLFPQLISGGAIVAMVLSLPTVGPLMLDALMNQDMYLAGSMLMVLSLVGVLGTLVSDLLLLWLDPRIRTEGGTK